MSAHEIAAALADAYADRDVDAFDGLLADLVRLAADGERYPARERASCFLHGDFDAALLRCPKCGAGRGSDTTGAAARNSRPTYGAWREAICAVCGRPIRDVLVTAAFTKTEHESFAHARCARTLEQFREMADPHPQGPQTAAASDRRRGSDSSDLGTSA